MARCWPGGACGHEGAGKIEGLGDVARVSVARRIGSAMKRPASDVLEMRGKATTLTFSLIWSELGLAVQHESVPTGSINVRL
jgi:hypothetical protein